jgi:hypothetical protein
MSIKNLLPGYCSQCGKHKAREGLKTCRECAKRNREYYEYKKKRDGIYQGKQGRHSAYTFTVRNVYFIRDDTLVPGDVVFEGDVHGAAEFVGCTVGRVWAVTQKTGRGLVGYDRDYNVYQYKIERRPKNETAED